MRVEICIAKEKISKMPKGSVSALQQEMLRRVSKRY
ncbi:damage-inducible protein DinI, partial [Escherichia coli]|nr:damage-inducible protein DinI [Escherichia coli]EEQ3139057.1 DinI family protein [Escherichia coli]EES4981055.1 DinI family protein [Escherichia coli]EGD8017816.1 DinI family protein [Escherichia coli]EMA4897070.1 DinI family protein [Escherichia coli]